MHIYALIYVQKAGKKSSNLSKDIRKDHGKWPKLYFVNKFKGL